MSRGETGTTDNIDKIIGDLGFQEKFNMLVATPSNLYSLPGFDIAYPLFEFNEKGEPFLPVETRRRLSKIFADEFVNF